MKFFVDSCIFIEAFKTTGTREASDILENILKHVEFVNFYINSIVESEVLYYFGFKQKSKLKISKEELNIILKLFEILSLNKEVRTCFWQIFKKYNLKPNDALILATCKYYRIKYLISIDNDFPEPCKKEGIVLINSAEKLKEFLEKEDL
jgi:predicted nucleic acid-binding protein